MKKIEVIEVETDDAIALVVSLADTIWREHYTSIIGTDQVDYMLEKFQSKNAITNQIESNTSYFLLNLNEQPVGYLSYYPKGETLFLSKIYVLQEYRGKGIGKAGMSFVQAKSKALGFRSITLTVNKYNTSSIMAYEKLDFQKIESVVVDIGEGFVMDDFVMIKQIAK